MADERKKKLQPVDFVGIGNLLNHFVAEDAISCDERDRIIQRIAKDNDLPEHSLPVLTVYERSKNEALELQNCGSVRQKQLASFQSRGNPAGLLLTH